VDRPEFHPFHFVLVTLPMIQVIAISPGSPRISMPGPRKSGLSVTLVSPMQSAAARFTVVGGQTLSSGAGVPGGTVLSYAGVQYNNITSVEDGAYSYWVYEHMYYNPNNTDTNSNTTVQKENRG